MQSRVLEEIFCLNAKENQYRVFVGPKF